ncbi:MAG: UDP-N-acetylmuramate dehydrogenase [Bacillota bacterium]|nr:UDP-N-acetylmuramate dehydrogenase [Bacillota bacterium]
MNKATIIQRLEKITDSRFIVKDAPMAEYTSFKAGGKADVLVEPQNERELAEILKTVEDEGTGYMVLGNGSNILVRDGGFKGVIIKIGDAFNYVRQEGNYLICGSGTLMAAVSRKAAAAGLAGLEFASGIPGSIGGAVFMNAGAYGGEMVQVIDTVKVISKDGNEALCLTADELQMGYRHSVLQETGDVAVEVRLELQPGDPEKIKENIADFTQRRNSKQPVTYPSAGSFFKRPEGYFAGKLIQDAGLKGLCIGGAQVSELHSGFIINKGGATASDILQLMEVVQADVYDKFGVMLEPEVRIIGEEL